MTPRIAVIGSNNMDLVTYVTRVPEAGETIEAPSFEIGFGGKGANQAVAAGRLGASVLMITKVGDDSFGAEQIRNFEANGIDTRHVGRVANMSSGVAPIMVEPNGENRIIIVKGANAELSPADVDAAEAELATCRLILLQLETSLDVVYHAIEFGHRHGIEVLLNPAPAAADLDPARIRDATFLVPNETELALLTGMAVTDEASCEAAARKLIAAGTRCVIVTMGAKGALLVEGEKAVPIRAFPVEPVDTTGAGDAFIGSFAHFYVSTGNVEASLKLAARYAAQSTLKRGTQKSYPTAEEFAAF
ncbi:ribokinase [Aureimonas endophytica]|uniref:Ribokinase n=1 Tax=Aureimonas endophytica TaxID=2027858 RepID=A0A916ZDM8_9HYPH|nr:ribokinase [Aureimonas endophytica]GGD90211.1 ribokinase [Aureimonas endophytica]